MYMFGAYTNLRTWVQRHQWVPTFERLIYDHTVYRFHRIYVLAMRFMGQISNYL